MQSPAEYAPDGTAINHQWDLVHFEFKQQQSDSKHYHVITLWSRDDKKVTEEITSVLEKNFPLPAPTQLNIPTISTVPPALLKKRIKDGQDALARGLQGILKPGVKLDLPDFIPQFSVDANDPTILIKKLNGKTTRGTIIGGKFVPLARQVQKKAVSKKKLTKR
jgi:hypothetical protein